MPRGGKRSGAGRKSVWNHSRTTVIRVPEVFSEDLLRIARAMDEGKDFESVTKSKSPVSSATNGADSSGRPLQVGMNFGLGAQPINVPPLDADGCRWVTSKQAYTLAQERGCQRNLEGFKRWSKRNPDDCEQMFSLRRLIQSKRNTAPAFEDLNFRCH